jgi:hypothetical protein
VRTPGEIRKHLLRIRDGNQLSYAMLQERSRCSYNEIMSALRLEATQDTLIRLDAFLDAPKLHVRRKETKLLWQVEEISREVWREFGMSTPHPLRVQRMSEDQQKRLYNAIDFKAKCCFVQMMYVETGLRFKIPDGQSYWQFKVKCLRRAKAVCAGDGDADRFPRPRPVGQGSRV